MSEFEPKILAFCCNWCSYAGADLAGVSRFKYPANVRDIRVMCSARVDPVFVFRAFEKGLDGVAILGCHLGDCHYVSGNYHTLRRAPVIKRLLDLAGVNPGRFLLEWVSAAEGQRFAQVVTEFTELVRGLGPLGESEGIEKEQLKQGLAAAADATVGERLRWLVGKKYSLDTSENVFGEKLSEEKFNELLEAVVRTDYFRSLIMQLAKQPVSCTDIAAAMNLPPTDVLNQLVVMRKKGLIDVTEIKEQVPYYAVIV